MPDLRFIATGLLLKKKGIRFRDIYLHIPPTVIAEAIGATYQRMQKLIKYPEQWSIGEIKVLAALFKIDLFLLM